MFRCIAPRGNSFALLLRPKRDELGSHLEIGIYGAESELLVSILGKQFAQQRWTNASGYELTCHIGMVSFPWTPALSCMWMAKKWKCFDESDSTDGSLCVSQRCTDGSLILYGWVFLNFSARRQPIGTHMCNFCCSEYAWTLSEVGNTHSFWYFGTNLRNQDNVTCNSYRGRVIMNWKANESSFLKYSSHSLSFRVNG